MEATPYAPLVAVLDTCWLMDLSSPQGRNFGIFSNFFSPEKLRRDEIEIQTIGPALAKSPEDFAAQARLGSEAVPLLAPYHMTRFRKPALQKMNFGNAADICDALRGKVNSPNREFAQFLRAVEFAERDFRIDFEVVLPTEMKQEIGRNLKHPQKAGPAKNARVVFAELLELPCFREVDLANVPPVEMSEAFLGPDSDVDKALVSYSVQRARAGANVLVATNDGGILAECASLCSKKKLPIFTPLNWRVIEEIYTQQFETRLAEYEKSPEQSRSKGWWFLKPSR